MSSTFMENLYANAILAGGYLVYKIFDRCLHSRCKFTKEGGLDFDLGDPDDSPAVDMAKLGDLLKQRSQHYRARLPPAGPPPRLATV